MYTFLDIDTKIESIILKKSLFPFKSVFLKKSVLIGKKIKFKH